ncbi:hypothetical protein BS47DRAFT_1373014 [Hydnum rufescens UP504]|uniref:NADPH-dependent diflavin oxidoreductase 1 n=1 Tax=Hydnum rufescens UP504 TaxID=1448309 RepID=A0A9P6DUC4_9AGAM|nr:hypothetical protein BS47DRAFT_1373014 [Hydnum rufescens UP504]
MWGSTASETGNAEDAAERIGRQLRRRHFRTRTVAMDAFDIPNLFDENLVLFVCSTTGNGAEPHNMTAFWNALLRADLPADLLDHLDIAVFGIGDSSYERFCWASKKLHRRLLALGAHQILDRADADEQHYLGVNGTLDTWLKSLGTALDELYPLPPHLSILPDASTPNLDSNFCLFKAPACLGSMRRITHPDWFQDVRHIEFDVLDDISINQIRTGDVAVLFPANDPADVNYFISRQNWESIADNVYEIRNVDRDRPVPQHIPIHLTLRELITQYLDIAAVPRLSFFEFCKNFADDARERERLEEFCSPEGQDDLFDYCQRPRRTILEVLAEFKSVKIPLDYVLDVFSVIRPRKFSIASALKAHPGKIQLCVAIVRYRSLSLRVPRKGLCSNWLTRLRPGDEVEIGLERGTLAVPEDNLKPVVLIGPGTGIAPMRAILEHRVAMRARDNLLYLGCRSIKADFHYHDEMAKYADAKYLSWRVAASRDQDHKVYVQDEIARDSTLLHEYVYNRGGSVYISGSSNKMPAAVRKAIEGVLQKTNDWTDIQAKEYILQMEREGRWSEETWA